MATEGPSSGGRAGVVQAHRPLKIILGQLRPESYLLWLYPPEWGEAGIPGQTSGPLTEFSASESSELLITTMRSSETRQRRQR